ncbi:MAG: hypothetical protein Nk1A_6890 [Endomicrobiia bacterium]|nr:MAG: hypothetical protein Nk1A_6890 [Endomicrobiia bacterium]
MRELKSKRLKISLTPSVYEALKQEAKKKDISMSKIVNRLIISHQVEEKGMLIHVE